MADRRNTPDILGDLLGGSPLAKQKENDAIDKSVASSGSMPQVPKGSEVPQNDPQYFENLLHIVCRSFADGSSVRRNEDPRLVLRRKDLSYFRPGLHPTTLEPSLQRL